MKQYLEDNNPEFYGSDDPSIMEPSRYGNPTLDPVGTGLLRDSDRNWGNPTGGYNLTTEYMSNEESLKAIMVDELNSSDPIVKKAANELKDSYLENELLSTGKGPKSYAWESTAMGACRVINPLPQFGRDDDIVPEYMEVDDDGDGIGEVYQKMYLDNMRIMWVRAGHPKFSNIKRFMSDAVSATTLSIMTDPNTSISIKLGTLLGSGIAMAISIALIPVTLFGMVVQTYTGGAFNHSFKYCSFRPQQHLWFKAWTNILVSLQVQMKLGVSSSDIVDDQSSGASSDKGPTAISDKSTVHDKARKTDHRRYLDDLKIIHDKYKKIVSNENNPTGAKSTSGFEDMYGEPVFKQATKADTATTAYTTSELEAISANMPFVLQQGGDIIAILSRRINRRKKIHKSISTDLKKVTTSLRAFEQKMAETKAITNPTFVQIVVDKGKQYFKESADTSFKMMESLQKDLAERLRNSESIQNAKNKLTNSETFDAASKEYEQMSADIDAAASVVADKAASTVDTLKALWKGAVKIFNEVGEQTITRSLGELNFIGFRVERGMSMSEGMSNSYGEPAIANKVKSMTDNKISQTLGTLKHTGFAPVDAIANFVSSAVTAAGASVSLGGVGALLIKGGGHLDFPKCKWEGSSSSGKSVDLTMNLMTPNPTPENVFQHMYIPLAGAIALCYPRGIGKSAYSAPFVVQVSIPGQVHIPLGVCSSIRIERGSDEYGWTAQNLPRSIKVTMTFEDLSPMMYISTTDAELFDFLTATTSFQDYITTLSGVELVERLHGLTVLARRRKIRNKIWAATYFNPSYWGDKLGDSRILQAAGSLKPLRSYRAGRY